MNAFYSILYAPIRPEAKELLSVGLLMRDRKNLIFHFSKNKVNVIKDLLSKEAFTLFKISLDSIQRAIQEANIDLLTIQDSLIQDESYNTHLASEPYISYLSVYNKNLLSFSSPVTFNQPLSNKLFQKLFSKFIDETEVFSKLHAHNEIDIIQKTREHLFPRIKSHVNIDYTITSHLFKQLLLPTIKVDFIGKNDKYVIGQTMDFTKRETNLESDISRQITLFNAIKEEKEAAIHYIIGKEPDKKQFPQQHLLWTNVYNYKHLQFIDSENTNEIENFLREHKVCPIES